MVKIGAQTPYRNTLLVGSSLHTGDHSYLH